MNRHWKLTGLLLLGLGLAACPPAQNSTELRLAASPNRLDGIDQTATITATAVDANGQPGTGSVTFKVLQGGKLDGSLTETTKQLEAGGTASVNFSCRTSAEPACRGVLRVEATWNTLTSSVSIQVGTTTNPGTDGGTNPGTDGGTNPGTDGGTTPPAAGQPANIVFIATSTRPQLGIRSSNLDVSTPVAFEVTDLRGRAVSNIRVQFEVRGVGGVALSPTESITNAEGRAATTLLAGDEVGIATVVATAFADGPPSYTLTASSLGTPVVGARPSDEGLVVQCSQINLAANASETPPRVDLSTDCRAQLVDRFKNPVTLPTSVSWSAEAGSIRSPVRTDGNNPGAVTTTFASAGKWPPAQVVPIVRNGNLADPTNEPTQGTFNPRDMLVTIIAVSAGEEEFHDGSGVSNGLKNGRWDPGEWFVDVSEPYVDENDNQQYDPGEAFIDTERLDCATNQRVQKNGRWDGPNGCWDGDTLIWRPTHIVYSGFSSYSPPRVTFSPSSPTNIYTAPGSVLALFSDAYFNPISPDNATWGLTLRGNRKGGASLSPSVTAGLNFREYGMQIFHERVWQREDGTVVECDPTRAAPAGAVANPSLARCFRRYRFGTFGRGNWVDIVLENSEGASTSGTLTLQLGNRYSSTFSGFGVNFP
jgi:hypothetical protein